MKEARATVLAVLAALTLVVPVHSVISAQSGTGGGRETFTAFAVDLGGSTRRTSTSQVKITIDRWSTDEERRRLVSSFTEGGEDDLLKTLRDLKPLGRISTPDSIGYDLRYAHQMPLASGGRRIIIATDRPMSYWESTQRPRSVDYPYTFIEMRIGADGKGQGKMTVATKVNMLGTDTIELENYDMTPVQLSEIRSSRK
jgi:hypothetical protein